MGKLIILKLHSESNDNIGLICKIIEARNLGLTLSNCLQSIEGKDLMSAYIHDFLCMDYPVCSDNELEVSYYFIVIFKLIKLKKYKVMLIFYDISIQTIVKKNGV